MSGPFATHTRSLRPAALSAFGLFTASTLSRPSSSGAAAAARCTKFLVRPASEVAPRECPTPLVLLRATGLGEAQALAGGVSGEWVPELERGERRCS